MKTYENYSWRIISTTIAVQLAIYCIAGYIILQFGMFWFAIYLIYFAILEITFYPKACVFCHYYGKWCAFGKGKVAGLLFKQKDPKKFCDRKVTLLGLLPEMLVLIVPVVLGIVLLVQDFSWIILGLIVLHIFLNTSGNALVRKKLACPHCAQGKICCPARDMFTKASRNTAQPDKNKLSTEE